MDVLNKPKPQAFYKQHLLVDIRDFQSQLINKQLSITVRLTDIGVPPYSVVQSVELKGINFPKLNGENYFVLDIPEFSGRVHSSDNKGSHNSFAVCYYDNIPTFAMKPMKGKDFDEKKYIFNPPEKNFNKFTINFKKYGGDLITFSDFVVDPVQTFVEQYPISILLELDIK